MYYVDFQDTKLSALGMGCMRLPVVDGDDARIDEAATFEMIYYAYNQGINCFDTAWGYHAGHSEEVVGRALARYPRESFYLATKFPGYDTANFPRAREIFEEQLRKCSVEYFDFYLLHNVNESNIEFCLDPQYGTTYCPIELDIPELLRLYIESCAGGGSGGFISFTGLSVLEPEKGPEDCIGCGSCAAVCPQNIDMPTHLAAFAEKMGRA